MGVKIVFEFFLCVIEKHDFLTFSSFSFRSSSPDVLRKTYSENVLQIYRKAPIPKCDRSVQLNFIEVTLWHGILL